MCQATIYMVKGDQRQEVMRDVIQLVPVEQGVRLQRFFEEPVVVPGRVTEIDFLKHTVTLVPLAEQRETS